MSLTVYDRTEEQAQSTSAWPVREQEVLRKSTSNSSWSFNSCTQESMEKSRLADEAWSSRERVSIWRGFDISASKIPIEAIHFQRASPTLACLYVETSKNKMSDDLNRYSRHRSIQSAPSPHIPTLFSNLPP